MKYLCILRNDTVEIFCLKRYFLFFQGKPTQPTNLKASSIRSHNITVTWTHGNHYKTVFYSKVTYTEGKLKPKTDTVNGPGEIHMIKNLKPFTSYTITVITCIHFKVAHVLCSDASKAILVTTAMSGIILLEILYRFAFSKDAIRCRGFLWPGYLELAY